MIKDLKKQDKIVLKNVLKIVYEIVPIGRQACELLGAKWWTFS